MPVNYLVIGPVTPALMTACIEGSGRTDTGGQSVFIGRVRADEIIGRKVLAIEYSAYENMVKAEAEKIRQAILSEFSDARIVEIIHSTGIVKAGEISLLVVVSAGHRNHAVEACRKTVELIKQQLPVWKKEIYDDNSSSWKENASNQTGS
jgi:molybdopterin synthase catalytic subunit